MPERKLDDELGPGPELAVHLHCPTQKRDQLGCDCQTETRPSVSFVTAISRMSLVEWLKDLLHVFR